MCRLIQGLMNMHYSILHEQKHKRSKDNNKLTFMCYNNIHIKVTKTTFAKCAHILTQQPSKTSKLFMNSTIQSILNVTRPYNLWKKRSFWSMSTILVKKIKKSNMIISWFHRRCSQTIKRSLLLKSKAKKSCQCPRNGKIYVWYGTYTMAQVALAIKKCMQ